MRTRWLVRILLAAAIGWSLPAVASAQTSQPIPLPPPAANGPAGNPPVVNHTNAPESSPQQVVSPDDFTEAPRQSGRFHILPQSWRDAVARRFGRGKSAQPNQSFETPPADGASSQPLPGAEMPGILSGVVPVSSRAAQPEPIPPPQSQLIPPLPQQGSVAVPLMGAPLVGTPLGPQPNETWASPPEPPITGDVPLPYRDPGMAWRKMPVSAPSDLPPPPAPRYPRHFYLLPEGMRTTLGHCLNGCGMGCYADRDTPGCGSLRQEFLFVFGSCRYFFGESCFPDY